MYILPMHSLIKCKFCHTAASYSPVEEATEMNVERHWCDGCRVEYLVFQYQMEPNSWSIYTCRNNKFYRWTQTASGRAILYHVGQMFTNEYLSRDCRILIALSVEDTHPEITPDNFPDKLSAYLLFL